MRIANSILILLWLFTNIVSAQGRGPLVKNFAGQLSGVSSDLLSKIAADPKLKDAKFRIGKVTSAVPDSNYEPEIARRLSEIFKARLDDGSDTFLNAEYKYIGGLEADNFGLQVIEILLNITDRRGRPLQSARGEISARREVNDSDDISKILNVSVAIPDSADLKVRNDAADQAFVKPRFAVRNKSEISVSAEMPYTVQVLVRRGGSGELTPVIPQDHGGLAFVDLSVRDTFEIAVRNYDSQSLVVADISIDGLSVVNTFSEDNVGMEGYPGYLVDRAQGSTPAVHIVSGWLRTAKPVADNVFTFVINEFGKGAATALKSQSSRGVIIVQFYRAAPPGKPLVGRSFGEIGTGKPTTVDYKLEPVQLFSEAECTIAIRYSIPPEIK